MNLILPILLSAFLFTQSSPELIGGTALICNTPNQIKQTFKAVEESPPPAAGTDLITAINAILDIINKRNGSKVCFYVTMHYQVEQVVETFKDQNTEFEIMKIKIHRLYNIENNSWEIITPLDMFSVRIKRL